MIAQSLTVGPSCGYAINNMKPTNLCAPTTESSPAMSEAGFCGHLSRNHPLALSLGQGLHLLGLTGHGASIPLSQIYNVFLGAICHRDSRDLRD